uniref:PH domain-containing protein n=1 Tax=Manihot esculenta TaxID=3983 RepID=A0A2C9U1E2_MANES
MPYLCCISAVSNHSSAKSLPMAITSRSDQNIRSISVPRNHHSRFLKNLSHHNGTDGNESNLISVSNRPSQRGLAATLALHTLSLPREQQVDVRINDIVGNGISGILHKWVNYGKGWRPRWFVLQDGVLSYYKIHGANKIVVNRETEKGSKVIGEESLKRISRPTNGNTQFKRNPVGEIHLKVSSIRESRSDDKRFSIFTGTKKLHLRAETREDRLAWMEALQAVKDMFPRMSNSELMAPIDNLAVSTEKLRQRLQEEGVREEAIQDSEQIMKNEFASLQNQIVLLKQKQRLLIDTLRQLENFADSI